MSMRVRLAKQQAGENVAAANQPAGYQANADDDQNEGRDGTEFQGNPSSLREEGPEAVKLWQEEEMQEIDIQASSADKSNRPTGFAPNEFAVHSAENVRQQQYRGEGEYPFEEEVGAGDVEVKQHEGEERGRDKDQFPFWTFCPACEGLETRPDPGAEGVKEEVFEILIGKQSGERCLCPLGKDDIRYCRRNPDTSSEHQDDRRPRPCVETPQNQGKQGVKQDEQKQKEGEPIATLELGEKDAFGGAVHPQGEQGHENKRRQKQFAGFPGQVLPRRFHVLEPVLPEHQEAAQEEKQRQVEQGYGIVGRTDSLLNAEGYGSDVAVDDQEDGQSAQCVQICEPPFYFHKIITLLMIGAMLFVSPLRFPLRYPLSADTEKGFFLFSP